MQKTLLSTTALLIAAGIAVPAFAQFTISAGVQSTQMFIESETEFVASDPSFFGINPLNLSDSEDNQDTDIGGELALGYQFNFNSVYNVALEVFGQLSATHVNTPTSPNGTEQLTSLVGGGAPIQDATASFDWLAGLRLRPGIYITPATRVFIDGGVVWGGFELEQSETSVAFINDDLGTDFGSTENETLVGWRYGAGMEYKMSENFAVGVDYTITEFDEFTSDFVEDAGEAYTADGEAGPISSSAEYVPTLHTLGLNFKYLFGTKKQPPRQRHYEMRDK